MKQLIGILTFCVIALTFIFCSFEPAQAQLEEKVLVCYWGTWSFYRNETYGHFSVNNIPPDLCTHIVYAFYGLNNKTNTVTTLDENLDHSSEDSPPGQHDMLRKTVALRKINPRLKITLAIGGWTQGSINYSEMAKNSATRCTFILSVIDVIKKFDLDGVDMDWEYPARREGVPEDKENFVLLLKEFREALDSVARSDQRGPLLLTSAFGCYEKFLDVSYDIPGISKYLDYFHLMLYDFKMYLENDGSEDVEPGSTLIGHHSPLFSKEWEDEGNKTMTTSFAVESFIAKGAPPEKLVLGVGTYAKTYRLFNRQLHNFYDAAAGPGEQSVVTVQPGTSAMFEMCREFLDPNVKWEMGFDNDYKIPYAFSDTKWLGYDDALSARIKTDYAMEKGLGGMMVWTLDFDDFDNYCQGWRNFPVVNSLKDSLLNYEQNNKRGRRD